MGFRLPSHGRTSRGHGTGSAVLPPASRFCLSPRRDTPSPWCYHAGVRTLRVTVTDSEYETFRRAAEAAHRPMAKLLRDAIALVQREKKEIKAPLRDLPVLPGHRPLGDLPSHADLYEEMFSDEVFGGQP
jgi:hypothetical protein